MRKNYVRTKMWMKVTDDVAHIVRVTLPSYELQDGGVQYPFFPEF